MDYRSSSDATAVAPPEENPGQFISSSPQKTGQPMPPSHHGRSSESACSEIDTFAGPPCTCPSCPQHGSPTKPDDGRLEEFIRRSALHGVNAELP